MHLTVGSTDYVYPEILPLLKINTAAGFVLHSSVHLDGFDVLGLHGFAESIEVYSYLLWLIYKITLIIYFVGLQFTLQSLDTALQFSEITQGIISFWHQPGMYTVSHGNCYFKCQVDELYLQKKPYLLIQYLE